MNMKTEELRKIWQQVPPDYYEEGILKNPFQKIWHTLKWITIKKMIVGNTKSILDIGCASGWMTAKIAETLYWIPVTGVDVSPEMINYAEIKHPGINFICADAHKLPFGNETFDLIICTEVLEHVSDPLRVLLEIRRCLCPKGKVIISMDSGNLLFKIIWFLWTKTKGKVWKNAHLHEFNREKLQKLFKKTNFKVDKLQISHFGMALTFKLSKIDI